MKYLKYENGPVDRIDRRLLQALSDNARISNTALGRLVGLSAPSVSERLKRLEESGVITGYSAKINVVALGLGISAWIRIKPLPGRMKEVVTILKSLPEVTVCDRVTGEDCFVARVDVMSITDLEGTIDAIIPYATTNTSIIQSSPVQCRLPAFPGSV